MCYVLLLSTSSALDLTELNTERVRFSPDLPDVDVCASLRNPHRWYVGSKSGCSCTFRHLPSVELGFGEPVDWYPEGDDEIAATIELAAVVRRLVDAGEEVDCVDVWEDEQARARLEPIVEVDLARVSNEAFRLFENRHFVFKSSVSGRD